MESPLVSFIIPTLNEESVLSATLQNIAEYNMPHEIIVSDGGSTDATLTIAGMFPKVKIVKAGPEHIQSAAEGRNLGAYEARGAYIVEMDADTRFPNINEFFKIMISTFEQNPSIVGATTWFRVYPEDETIMDRIVYAVTGWVSMVIDTFLKYGATSGGEFQMVRRDAFIAVGGYNRKLHGVEDNDFFRRLSRVGRIHFERKLKIYHSGRRAHKVGWPRMIRIFITTYLSYLFFKKGAKEWTVIR